MKHENGSECLHGKICPLHGVPATACGGVHSETIPDECPACGEDKLPLNFISATCSHPYHNPVLGNYGEMISREGSGADAGGQADPLVQEPDK
jgi:hypothetical protein